MKAKIIVFLLFSNTYASSCYKKLEPLKVAKDLITIEFSGVRAGEVIDKNCMKGVYSHYQYSHEIDFDSPVKIVHRLSSIDSLKVSNIDRVSKSSHTYKASFSYVVDKKKVEDTITFYINNSLRAQKLDGCAATIEPPKTLSVLKTCIKK